MNHASIVSRSLTPGARVARKQKRLYQAVEILRSAVELLGRQTQSTGIAEVAALFVARMTQAERVGLDG